MGESELVLKMAHRVIRGLQRSDASIRDLVKGVSAATIMRDVDRIIADLKDSLEIINDMAAVKKGAAGLSIQNEMANIIGEVKEVESRLDGWDRTKNNARDQQHTIPVADLLRQATIIDGLLKNLRTSLLRFPKERLTMEAQGVIRKALKRIEDERKDIPVFIQEARSWR